MGYDKGRTRGNAVRQAINHLGFRTGILQQGKQQLLNLFLEGHCGLCQRSSPGALCPSCHRQVQQCQLSQEAVIQVGGLPVLSWGVYDGSLRQALRRLKYDGQQSLGPLLGHDLGRAWQRHLGQATPGLPAVVVPIPLHATRLQQRGFNQAALVAAGFCRQTGLTLCATGLRRVEATTAQHSLTRQQRQANLAQAFAVNPAYLGRLRRQPLWLLDDIFTTGATVQVAVDTLRRAGLSVAGVCTVARAIALA
jgi:ComF family protein